MQRTPKTLCAVLIAIFALGPLTASADEGAIYILERARAKMRELAEEDIPSMDLGKQTQDKQEAVIAELDTLIQVVLDHQARQGTDQQDDDEREYKHDDFPTIDGECRPGRGHDDRLNNDPTDIPPTQRRRWQLGW